MPGTTATVGGIPNDGRTIFVRIWAFTGNAWQTPRDYQYTACNGCQFIDPRAVLTTPAPGSILTATSLTFSWSAGEGTSYWLDVGSNFGAGDISAGETALTSKQVSGLPNYIRTIFVRLWTKYGGVWQVPRDYLLTACNGCASTDPLAAIGSPPPGSQFTSSAVTFVWGQGSGNEYWLDVGTARGQGNVSAGSTTATNKLVTGLPNNGSVIHVRLWTRVGGVWQGPRYYEYTACSTCAATEPRAILTTPVPYGTFGSRTVQFIWAAGTGASEYWLDVGTSFSMGNLNAGATTATNRTVMNLPNDGRTVFVRLWTKVGGTWLSPLDYIFNACSGC